MSIRVSVDQDKSYVDGVIKIKRYRPEIDGLRAFAVVAVIINYFDKNILPGGYLGVDIFFVISGYVITSSLFERPSKDFKDFISGFYGRRIRRLVPALSVFVLIMSIAICLFNPSPRLPLRTGISSLFGLSNLYLLKQSTDYFSQATELNVFTHTWSLGVEEQFYILFPFLIWFSGFGRQAKNGLRNLFLVVGVLTVASLILFLYLYPTNQSAAYFLMPSRFWELAAGCLIFVGLQKCRSIEQLLEKVPPFLALSLIVFVMCLPMTMPVVSTILIVVLSSVLIISLKKETAAFKIFANPSVVHVGLISYSLYLWHWGVLSISRWTIGIHWWSVPIQIVLMVSLAVASYRLVETPLRKGDWFGKRWKTLLAGGSVLVILSAGIIALGRSFKGFLYTGKFNTEDFIYVQDGMECELAGNIPTSNPLGCIDHNHSKNVIFVFGNSHASNLVPSVQSSALFNNFHEVKYLTNAWAGKMSGKHWHENSDVHRILEKTTKDDLIVWSHSYVVPKDRESVAHVISQIQYLSTLAQSTGVKILLVDDLPDFGGMQNFLPKFSLQQNGPSVEELIARKKRQFHTGLLKDAGMLSGVFYLDPFEIVCRDGICSSVIEGSLIYADSSPHFNKKGAQMLSEFMSRKISQIMQ